ncbi:uncharacterized protein G2W53_004645 [Senna tora]|uniref:Uncharacterized protein n=1 Tax=Senna tora TaxID=362788 RepID=A0A834XDQ4_9FABA|nr:uncharacterized protein G2W53_004645 [Senna tora]
MRRYGQAQSMNSIRQAWFVRYDSSLSRPGMLLSSLRTQKKSLASYALLQLRVIGSEAQLDRKARVRAESQKREESSLSTLERGYRVPYLRTKKGIGVFLNPQLSQPGLLIYFLCAENSPKVLNNLHRSSVLVGCRPSTVDPRFVLDSPSPPSR